MKLRSYLAHRRAAILERWRESVLAAYPDDTSRFLKQKKDRFANPVGSTVRQAVEELFEALTQDAEPEQTPEALDQMIRIKAVQDFSPSQALAFILELKAATREVLGGSGPADELLAFESRIDKMALMAFDVYVACREKIYELKANEARSRTFKLLERANLVAPVSDLQPAPDE